MDVGSRLLNSIKSVYIYVSRLVGIRVKVRGSHLQLTVGEEMGV